MDWEYIAIQRLNLLDLVAEINERIRQGYKPLGGICLSDNVYIQAMIKEKEDGHTD